MAKVGTVFQESDLPLDNGRVYHLKLRPEELASQIVLVGDPGRARSVAEEFVENWEVEVENRGLVTITGTAKPTGERVSIVTSGMGTPSTEIVLNEIVLLREIDLERRMLKEKMPEPVRIIRVGTSGGLQEETALGTLIVTEYAVGLDATGLFYNFPYPDSFCHRLEEELAALFRSAEEEKARFYQRIRPYVAAADRGLVKALLAAAEQKGVAHKRGITASSCGFFGPQGRDISRAGLTVHDVDGLLAQASVPRSELQFENMEMESSFLCHFVNGLGHQAGAVCVTIANRRANTFTSDYSEAIRNAAEIALQALAVEKAGAGGEESQ